MDNSLVIGIDLGTTNSCVSVFLDNDVKILENSDGENLTSSFVYLEGSNSAIVGKNGEKMADRKPQYGISDIKRFIGRKFSDRYIQNILRFMLFGLEADGSNNPLIVMKHNDQIVKRTPLDLCSIILQKLKRDVENKYFKVDKAVITVPAYFSVAQREVTLAAAKDAGFTVLKLLNEPTAAALSYYYGFDQDDENYSLVYDLGGGTFDVAILKKTKDNITIVSVDGDTQLGGHDFDNIITDLVCSKLLQKYNYNPKTDKKHHTIRRLSNKCEEAKKVLSSFKNAEIELVGLVPKNDYVELILTRQEFESAADELFKRTIQIIDNCVKNSGIGKNSIKEIILAGGSTRIPKIRQLLFNYFDGKPLNQLVNPDECVAEGAALQAAMLSKNPRQHIKNIKLIDVVPLSLGLADFVGEMVFIIKRNSSIPAKGSQVYETLEANQKAMYFQIYEGERLNVKKNRLLGELTISDITLAPPGQCQVTVTMDVDQNSILTVTAEEMHKNNVKQLKVEYFRGSKGSEETQDVRDAEKNKAEDEYFQKFAKNKGYLLQYCSAVIYNLKNKNLEEEYNEIKKICTQAQIDVESLETEDERKVKGIVEMVKNQCEDVVKRYNFNLMPILE